MLAGTLISVPIRVTSPDVIDNVSLSKVVAVNNSPISQLAMSVSKDPVVPGESLVYQFSIGNLDSTALTDVELRTALPVGATVDVIGEDGFVDSDTGEIVWNIESIGVGSTLQREVSITVASDAVAGEILTARAELRHDGGVALDASAEQATTVVASEFPITVDLSATPDPVAAGDRLLYEITVSNISAVPVDAVGVLFRVPAELSFIFSTDAEPNAACGTTVCSANLEANWALGTLAVGDSVTITIDALVSSDTSAGTLITAPVRVTSSDVIDHVNRISVIAVEAGE